MLRYSIPKLKKLKKFNLTSNRLIGGLNLKTLNIINLKFSEFVFMYIFRYKSFNIIRKFKQPDWCFFDLPDICYDNISYYSFFNNVEEKENNYNNLLNLLGLNNLNNNHLTTALDIVLDSESIVDTTTTILLKFGIIFFPFFESVNYFSNLTFTYLGSVVSAEDNFFSALNSSVFSGGSFCYIPKNMNCIINLSTYFRTHSEEYAQFERTLLISNENSYVKYSEGCSAPTFMESQLHVAIVEILAKKNSVINYSTIQNWYSGNQFGEGGLYNFTTKRGWCFLNAVIEWVQVELGSYITWKYPSTYLIGDNSFSSFFSLSLCSDLQKTDTGNKMLHIGSYTKSKVYSKSISLNTSLYIYRGLVKVFRHAINTYNNTECDSLILGKSSSSITIPYNIINNYSSYINQEANISKLEVDFLFFLLQRGINLINAFNLLIYGFCKHICSKLPLELELEIPLLILIRTKSVI